MSANAPAERNETVRIKTLAKVFIFKLLYEVNAELEERLQYCGRT